MLSQFVHRSVPYKKPAEGKINNVQREREREKERERDSERDSEREREREPTRNTDPPLSKRL